MQFKAGDVVHLKSDKFAHDWIIPMTVAHIDEQGNVVCIWRDIEGKIHTDRIPEEVLMEF